VPHGRFVTGPEGADLADGAWELAGQVWPTYNLNGDVLNGYWGRLYSERADFQFVYLEDDEVVGRGHTIPVAWDGTLDGLPAGIDGAISAGFEQPGGNVLCALSAEVAGGHQGQGLSAGILRTMVALARTHGLEALIAPVRPSWKDRYPLAPIEEYAAWLRDDGLPFDPWLRVHARLGAEILKVEPQSLRVTGTVAEWEGWTGMSFPASGTYWMPRGLAPVTIDREADQGAYWEPNVWMLHPV
jgi:GNAT superfamily N-acetyltransferase